MQSVSKLSDNQYHFAVWAPEKQQMVLHIVHPFDKLYHMQKDEWGYFSLIVETEQNDLQYYYQPEGGNDFPDPASQYQPQGVHGPSQTVDHSQYTWGDENWSGLPLNELIIYELHVGTFTSEGTFEAIIPRLPILKEVGINALELMPVSQFPGNRNWGYDGVFAYAVQNSYGGPNSLKKLVDACHQHGIAVILDVVYNHLGPEGNYLSQFGPYFTNKYCTPWGEAINFDGEWSDGVRHYFSENPTYWFDLFHIDGIRCDAIHAVFDNGAIHFWELVHNKVKKLQIETGKKYHLIAESDLNSPKVVKLPEHGGFGFNAQWLDDFHHALYVLINRNDKERYYDFGSIQQLAKAYTDGFVHSGEWVKFRKRKHGASSAEVPGDQFIVFNNNHDQIGNRVGGERLCMLVDFERIKLASAALLLSPYIPMFFMGEEYGDDTPFFYFISHSDDNLIKAVQEGRSAEFKDFGFDGEVPDPQSEDTFNRSKIHWEKRETAEYKVLLDWHKLLIQMRRSLPPLKNFKKQDVHVEIITNESFALLRTSADGKEKLLCFFNLAEEEVVYSAAGHINEYRKILDSREREWMYKELQATPAHAAIIQPTQTLRLMPLSAVVYHTTNE